ncbi:SET domain-containing protein, partial [Lentithecium fluviatile CBS 122367]
QINTYAFNPSHFRHEPYPRTLPPGSTWPPERTEDIVGAVPGGNGDVGCVGERCYTDEICANPFCEHTFEQWRKATAHWEECFELRLTEARGIGVFAQREFRAGQVLGWYAGEPRTLDNCGEGDYLMEMEIGVTGRGDSGVGEATVFIDAERKGNWTRFINHSCNPHAVFRIRRAGNLRIMAVEAIRDVGVGEELSVGYGDE